MSAGLKAAKALVDEAYTYKSSIVNDREEFIKAVLDAVNLVLDGSTEYVKNGTYLKSYIQKYIEENYK